MTKSKTVRKSEVALPAQAAPKASKPLKKESFEVPGVRLCMSEPTTQEQVQDACEEQIRELAYCKWEAAGCPSGDGFDFWLEAEQEILLSPSES